MVANEDSANVANDDSKWLNAYNLNKPKFYLRYNGDNVAAVHNKQDSLIFL